MNFIAKEDRQSPMAAPRCEPRVLWVFRNYDDRWCVHLEGGGATAYGRRDEAIELARLCGRAWGSYRLYLQLKDGRVTQELYNLGTEGWPDAPAPAPEGALRRRKSVSALFPPNGGTGMAP